MAASKLQALWNHPTGPKTIHFWAPTFKWGLIIANIADLRKPPQEISEFTQAGMFTRIYVCAAMVVTRAIWARYSTVITPKSLSLFSVSVGMAATGAYQLIRKLNWYDQSQGQEPGIAE